MKTKASEESNAFRCGELLDLDVYYPVCSTYYIQSLVGLNRNHFGQTDEHIYSILLNENELM